MLSDSSATYLKMLFRLWFINLKKQSLPLIFWCSISSGWQSLEKVINEMFFIVNVAHDQSFGSFVYDCVQVADPW